MHAVLTITQLLNYWEKTGKVEKDKIEETRKFLRSREMMSWKTLEDQQPDLAAFGKARLHNNVAYLATIRKDGSPRVHPFTPIIGEGHFFAFMEPTSPKGHDLRHDGRFAVHCSVSDTSGESGEFFVSGKAKFIEDF